MTIDLDQYINGEIFEFLLTNFYDEIKSCKDVEDLPMRAYIVIKCMRASHVKVPNRVIGTQIVKRAASYLKDNM